jgi:hypothetical protein
MLWGYDKKATRADIRQAMHMKVQGKVSYMKNAEVSDNFECNEVGSVQIKLSADQLRSMLASEHFVAVPIYYRTRD